MSYQDTPNFSAEQPTNQELLNSLSMTNNRKTKKIHISEVTTPQLITESVGKEVSLKTSSLENIFVCVGDSSNTNAPSRSDFIFKSEKGFESYGGNGLSVWVWAKNKIEIELLFT